MNKRTKVLGIMILIAALSRVMPHPPNFTPVAAMALFGGACFARRPLAFLIPLAAMLLSDIVLGLTKYGLATMVFSQPVVYGCLLANVTVGGLIKNRRSVWQIAGATLAGSCLFFVATNFAVWMDGTIYPLTRQGLLDCYVAALPFFRNTVGGDAFFAAILFGGLALLERRVAWMRASEWPTSA
jgi:hypothetical protein